MESSLSWDFETNVADEVWPGVCVMDEENFLLESFLHMLRGCAEEPIVAVHDSFERLAIRTRYISEEIHIEHQQLVAHYN